MPDSESFEAFYARTVGNVTSQMHALAGDDSAADHAIREAYARAYQQWYEISSYPDTEGWVLAVAREGYQRRRPMAAAPARDPARPGHDPLSMPGLFRPAPRSPSAGTGETTVAPPANRAEEQPNGWFTPTSRPAGAAADAGGGAQARGVAGLFGGRAVAPAAPSTTATARLAGDQAALSGQPTQPGEPWRPGRPAGYSARRRRPSATLIALVVVVALGAAAGIGYLLAGGHPAKRPTSHNTAAAHHGKPAVQMLAAGKTGSLGAIPWSLVGTGWTLAEVSTAAAGNGQTGTITTYLVDPQGGKYSINTSTGNPPQLLGWSGNGQNALLAVQPSAGAAMTYDLLSLTTGSISALQLPSGVTAVGFTRPDGLNILAVNQTASAFQLERFNLQGTYQATIGSLPVKVGVTPNWAICGTFCGALSSPNGLYAVWGVDGDEMQLVSNASGQPVIRRLTVPDSGSPPSCTPVTWWNSTTVLASCAVTGEQDASRLWLVPASGSTPTALTPPSGSPSGNGILLGAWQGPGAIYINSVDFAQCPNAPSGPGGLALDSVSGGSLQPVSVTGTTSNHTSVVSAVDGRLLLLAETSCPGSSSLLWLNPSTGATQTLLPAPASEVGVLAAAPFGLGPTATGVGLDG
jgi:hypothetical protein